MKSRIIISIGLILLGLALECLHVMTTINFLEIKLWLLGIIFILAGVIGLLWNTIIPLLENRAETLGRFKRKSRSKKSNH